MFAHKPLDVLRKERIGVMLDIGDLVICIETANPEPPGYINMPVVDSIYTIRNFIEDQARIDLIGIHLEEIINPPARFAPDGHWGECAFNIEWFRPVKKPSISIFREMTKKNTLENV